jgi:hypothetical protein
MYMYPKDLTQLCQELKAFSIQSVDGKFDGMTDWYDITHWNENIPETKCCFIQDERAMTILQRSE